MGECEIDFDFVRKSDYSKRKFRPTWSGQDILPDALNFENSMPVVELLNATRVWPPGF
jgi:hypothetical protein